MTNCEEALKYYQDKDKEKKDKKMTSYEFEVAAKNAVISLYAKEGIEFTVNEIDFVWFAHTLGFKKCTIWGKPMENEYAEVTYNRDKNEMYVDIYQKVSNTKIVGEDIDTKVHIQ